MSGLRRAVDDYLAVRRALGYKLRAEERLLVNFVSYLEQCDASRITVEAALAWATEPAKADPSWWAKRLSVVRGFARHLKTIEPDTEVPPTGLLPNRTPRTTPYLYSPAQIAALMGAARQLPSLLRAATFETLVGLMAVTGLRTGEAIGLDRDDVDLADDVITVRHSKFDKSRQVPLHPSTVTALAGYARRRDGLCPHPSTASFFISGAGTRLNHTNTSTTFARLVRNAGLLRGQGTQQPRLYGLRHSFAVSTLLDWYRSGVDVQARLPVLSTYLGHVKPASTYWYLEAVPELLAAAAHRLEHSWEEPS